eukprot:gb/GECG01010187.1/.p1 GENE.gb/GECG01010187.1/~~gb/GECG01010187.1/.p1  ORF type:complete len:1262 (+),score=152.44 gb/GECG01010187.1/:1-3786(+)
MRKCALFTVRTYTICTLCLIAVVSDRVRKCFLRGEKRCHKPVVNFSTVALRRSPSPDSSTALVTASVTPRGSGSPTATMTSTGTPSKTETSTATETASLTPTSTQTPSNTQTATPSQTSTVTPTVTKTPSQTPTPAASQFSTEIGGCQCVVDEENFIRACTDCPKNMDASIRNRDVRPVGIRKGAFSNLTNIDVETMNLGGLGLKFLERESFKGLDSMRTLDLSSNMIVRLEEFTNFEDSLQGDADANPTSDDPSERPAEGSRGVFLGLRNLRELSLRNNHINFIRSTTFGGLKQLTKLDLSNNNIDLLGSAFLELRTLKTLDLSNNGIQRMYANGSRVNDGPLGTVFATPDLRRLEELYLQHNSIPLDRSLSTFRESGDFPFSQLRSLKRLNLSNNQRISSVGSGSKELFYGLAQLETLWLKNVGFQVDPSDAVSLFTATPALKHLHLSNAHQSIVPPELFFGLTRLETLKFDDSSISSIQTGSFASLERMTSLDLSHNQLSAIPKGVFSEAVATLETLYLNNNYIDQIEVGAFMYLNNLAHLVLGNQKGESFLIEKNTFDGLGNLQELHLNKANVTNVRRGGFNGLGSCQFLDLSYNRLTDDLNTTFEGMGALQTLNLNHNWFVQPLALFNGLNTGSLQQLSMVSAFDNDQEPILTSTLLSGLTTLRHLYLNQNTFEMFEQNPFADLTSLRTLNLRGVTVKGDATLPSGVFTGLQSLQKLDLGKSSFSAIDGTPFKGAHGSPKQLMRVDWEGGHLSSLSTGSFSGLDGLRNLNLDGNKLGPAILSGGSVLSGLPSLEKLQMNKQEGGKSPLMKSSFKGLKNLLEVELSSSNVMSIEEDAFSQSGAIESVDLSENKLSRIRKNAFRGVSSLMFLDLSSNEIDMIDDIAFPERIDLREVQLNSNAIGEFHLSWLRNAPSLELLNLSHNSMERFVNDATDSRFDRFHTLTLNHNQLGVMQATSFTGFPNMEELELNQGGVTEFEAGIFSGLDALKSVSAEGKAASKDDSLNFLYAEDWNTMLSTLPELELEGNWGYSRQDCEHPLFIRPAPIPQERGDQTFCIRGLPTPTPSVTPSHTPTPSQTPSSTSTPSQTGTETPTPSSTSTPSTTETETATTTPTRTGTLTRTPTATPSRTPSSTTTPTQSSTVTPTRTPTNTVSNTPSKTATSTSTPTRTSSVSPSVTSTAAGPDTAASSTSGDGSISGGEVATVVVAVIVVVGVASAVVLFVRKMRRGSHGGATAPRQPEFDDFGGSAYQPDRNA